MTTALAVIQDFNEPQTSEASGPSDALSIWIREYRIDSKRKRGEDFAFDII